MTDVGLGLNPEKPSHFRVHIFKPATRRKSSQSSSPGPETQTLSIRTRESSVAQTKAAAPTSSNAARFKHKMFPRWCLVKVVKQLRCQPTFCKSESLDSQQFARLGMVWQEAEENGKNDKIKRKDILTSPIHHMVEHATQAIAADLAIDDHQLSSPRSLSPSQLYWKQASTSGQLTAEPAQCGVSRVWSNFMTEVHVIKEFLST